MKRRGFLAGLLGIPFAAVAAKRLKATEPKACETGCTCGCGTVSVPLGAYTTNSVATGYIQIHNPDGTITTNTFPCFWTFTHETGGFGAEPL